VDPAARHPDKVTGKAKFGMDTFLPNMVYAKVVYPPVREAPGAPGWTTARRSE